MTVSFKSIFGTPLTEKIAAAFEIDTECRIVKHKRTLLSRTCDKGWVWCTEVAVVRQSVQHNRDSPNGITHIDMTVAVKTITSEYATMLQLQNNLHVVFDIKH